MWPPCVHRNQWKCELSPLQSIDAQEMRKFDVTCLSRELSSGSVSHNVVGYGAGSSHEPPLPGGLVRRGFHATGVRGRCSGTSRRGVTGHDEGDLWSGRDISWRVRNEQKLAANTPSEVNHMGRFMHHA